jgi:hypothetical protein
MRRAHGHPPFAVQTTSNDAGTSVPSNQLARFFAEPPGKTVLLYGGDAIFSLALRMAAQAMADGSAVAVVDGGNRFNVHLLSRFARERRLNADDFLKRIFVSRGFTCYQMEQAVIHRLPAFLQRIDAHTALIFGLLDTFFDDQAPLREVQQILHRVLDALQHMKANGTSLLLVSREWNVAPKERNALFTTLKSGMDNTYRLSENGTALVAERAIRQAQGSRLGASHRPLTTDD